jgi:ribose transport system permease protein
MVAHTGAFAPQTAATDLMRFISAERIASVPVAFLIWAAVSLVVSVLLKHTTFGKALHSIFHRQPPSCTASRRHQNAPHRRPRLRAVRARGGTLQCHARWLCHQSLSGMGNAYLLPAIAAVVIGGTNILGARGRYLGTLLGIILVVLLNSVLPIMQMSEASRQIIYGAVIVATLFVYGRNAKITN